MIQLLVARGSRPTGRILHGILAEMGVRLGDARPRGVACYGVGYRGNLPALNANAGRLDKFQQGRRLTEARVSTVPHLTVAEALRSNRFPMLARKFDHVGGRDIMLALEPEDINMRVRAGAQFFTPYIRSSTEYRAYIFRRQHLGMYEKVLAHPEQYKKVGRNYGNGFAFQLVRENAIPRAAVDLAARAVTALDLDFGAVDMLHGRDGNFYVLEVNTAPGVEGANRQVIQGLARKIANWVEGGFLRRNGAA